MSIGSGGFFVEIEAAGWLGRWLKFKGRILDQRDPVGAKEWLEMEALYEIEADELEERKQEQELAASAMKFR